ncbi:MAG: ferritin family protein [Candidatus Omnitrophota bacterium]
MGNIFSGSEVIELGIEIEKNGRDFYDALAAKSKSEGSRATFLKLAREEEKHLALFRGMLDKAGSSEAAESYSDEYNGYMRALASESIFTSKDKGREIANSVKTQTEAIELGIGFEKDSILFYEGMKKAVPRYDHKVIDELIKEEQSHLRILRELKISK